ncbi:ATP-binding protein [Devosia neptuniae]|uniref:histidine kinase n=1 Tax=Devosia neptuniae TaxID=191302 RepID=A0ABY6CEB4_9HYPH|nr:ATP-binding protein [Devosia neptuniae]UXN69507.1 ATP-binding protein [Devosia neptuniae]
MAGRTLPLSPYQRLLIAVGCAVVLLASCLVAYEIALQSGIAAAHDTSERRLQIFDRMLEANIERYHFLPTTLAQASEIRDVLAHPEDDALRARANGFLSNMGGTAAAEELFIVDVNGRSIAASNWWTHQSMVGRHYAERPYFQEAMFDGAAKYYAVGITTGVPGYFIANRIDGPEGPLGVAVVKINLGEIEAVWWRSGELIGIFDSNDVGILSTRPDWRYRTLVDTHPSGLETLARDQRYLGVAINGQGIVQSIEPWRGTELAVLRSGDSEINGEFLVDRLRMPLHGWRLLSFVPLGPISNWAWTATFFVGVAVGAILLAAMLFMQRQRLIRARLEDHDQLEQRVLLRTSELQEANSRLAGEIVERQEAEKARQAAQQGLVQAAKLATLGQALAGVAHEVSQPIAALRTQTASAKLLARGKVPELADLFGSMEGVIGRLVALTGHLKTFARKETEISIQSDVVHIAHNAIELANHFREDPSLTITLDAPPHALIVTGNPVHIEQVLVNLISNAADAMAGLEDATIKITARDMGQHAVISVADNGTGIDPAIIDTLFDPFVTTKEPGRGLGLGLSISYGLIREMGGRIEVESRQGEGATFTITLPLAEITTPQIRDFA